MNLTRLFSLPAVAALACTACATFTEPDGAEEGDGRPLAPIQVLRGTDRASVFSPEEARFLQSSFGVAWTGVYLGGPCSAGSGWSRQSVEAIANATGWQFLPIYVGAQLGIGCSSTTLGYGQGQRHGQEAAALMRSFGWAGARGIPVALDLERPTYDRDPGGTTEYARGWLDAVHAAGYLGYVYGSFSMLNAFADARLPVDGAWVAAWLAAPGTQGFRDVQPYDERALLGSNFSTKNRAWQYNGDFVISGAGRIDANVSDLQLAPAPGGGHSLGRRLDLFTRGADARLHHRYFDSTLGGWGPDENLNVPTASGPAVASYGQDHLDIFWTGEDHQLWHMAWDVNHWTTPDALGGFVVGEPAVASWGPGRLDVFVRSSDNAIYRKAWTAAGGWAGWEWLGGSLSSSPTVTSWGPGHLDVFATGTDFQLWHLAIDPAIGVSPWEPLGGIIDLAPAVTSWGPGHLDVFARGRGDHQLFHKSFDAGWSGWEPLGGVLASAPTATSWGFGHLDVFTRGTDNQVWHRGFEAGWTNWEPLGGPISATPDAASWQHHD